MDFSLVKRPGAIVPLLMSLCALSLVLGHAAVYGITHETDEGTAAHLFQILIAGQLPVIAWFALRWMPRNRQAALNVLALQMLAAIIAILPVYWLT